MKVQDKLVAKLHSAANEGQVELVRLLLRCGADVNAQDEQFGNTALHQAAWKGFSQTVQVLCKYRANTSLKNKTQFTPLHLACQQGHNQCARLLLMASAKSEAKNSYGDTPLHTAARYGHAGVARILLSAKCNPNQVNKNHDTPLHIAAAMGRRKLTKIFMQNGAEPAIKNKQNETPMDIALRKDLINIQELIANPPPALGHAHSTQRRSSHASTAELLLLPDEAGEELGLGGAERFSAATNSRTHQRSNNQAKAQRHRRLRQMMMMMAATNRRCSSEDEESDSIDQQRTNGGLDLERANSLASLEPLEEKFASSRLRLGSHSQLTQCSSGTRPHHLDKHRKLRVMRSQMICGAELAVDVPDFLLDANKNSALSTHKSQQVLVNGENNTSSTIKPITTAAASVHSLVTPPIRRDGCKTNGAGESMKPKQQLNANRRLRTKTLCATTSDLHFLPGLLAARNRTRAETPELGVSSNQNGNKELKELEGEKEDEELGLREEEEEKEKGQEKKGVGEKAPSPNGSVRSSLSRARRRLIVSGRARYMKGSAATNGLTALDANPKSLLSKRANAGSCFGKLSLLRLRSNQRAKQQLKEQQQQQLEEEQEEELNNDEQQQRDGSSSMRNIVEEEQKFESKGPIALGRRQERQVRQQQLQEQQVAPNGAQLRLTRPLASLNDDTQLYAIPHKSNANNNNKSNSNNNNNKQQVASSTLFPEDPSRRPSEQGEVQAKQDEAKTRTGAGQDQSICDSPTAAAAATERNKENLTAKHAHSQLTREGSSGPALTSDRSNSSDSSFANADDASNAPSTSSTIASSSDECIESLEANIVRSNKNKRHTGNEQPAVVGVHADRELYSNGTAAALNGYANTGVRSALMRCSPEAACLCDIGAEEKLAQPTSGSDNKNQKGSSETSDKENHNQLPPVVVNGTKTTSKLRQLLHLESGKGSRGVGERTRSSTPSKNSITTSEQSATGPTQEPTQTANYYAYSPVVQSSSELEQQQRQLQEKQQQQQKPQVALEKKPNTSKKSWFKSKFSSLSSSNNQTQEQKSCRVESVGPKKEEVQVEAALVEETNLSCADEPPKQPEPNFASSDSEHTLLGLPERRPELISINNEAPAKAQKLELDSGALIRPKGALSATSADLIAAQKSLAAAAAAKVNRDRLTKPLSNQQQQLQHQQQQQLQHHHHHHHHGMLTVKTSLADSLPGAFGWNNHAHSVFQEVGVGGAMSANQVAAIQLEHEQNNFLMHHRSGTNSVGMSDSSPSNNGADSDNSLQTTTGSAHTDTTANSSPANQHQSTSSPPTNSTPAAGSSPLGILSRILLNNKSIGYTGAQKQQQSEASDTPTTNSSAGSSTLQASPKQQLDQQLCASRSRCPIVLSRSNISSTSSCSSTNSAQPEEENRPPPLPAKGVLKNSGNLPSYLQRQQAPPFNYHDSMNCLPGVPMVRLTTQMTEPKAGLTHVQHRTPLCNYHALNQQQPRPFSHALFQPGHSDFLMQARSRVYGHHLSQQDLRYITEIDRTTPAPLSNALPATAINYEYYLNQPTEGAASYQMGGATGVRQSNGYYNRELNFAPAAQEQHRDSSIVYVQPNSDILYKQQQRSGLLTSSLNSTSTNGTREGKLNFLTHHHQMQQQQQQMMQHHHQQLLRARPKSSLDSILLSNPANHHQHHNQILSQPLRVPSSLALDNHQSATHLRSENKDSTSKHHGAYLLQRAVGAPNIQQNYGASTRNELDASGSSTNSQLQNQSRFSLYSQENSIYASDQSNSSARFATDLTVLPTHEVAPPAQSAEGGQRSTSAIWLNGGGDAEREREKLAPKERRDQCPSNENSWKPQPAPPAVAPSYKSLVQINRNSQSVLATVSTNKSNQSSNLITTNKNSSVPKKAIKGNTTACDKDPASNFTVTARRASEHAGEQQTLKVLFGSDAKKKSNNNSKHLTIMDNNHASSSSSTQNGIKQQLDTATSTLESNDDQDDEDENSTVL